MHLSKLKAAWQQYKLQQSLDRLESESIMALIDQPEKKYAFTNIGLINGLLLPLLMTCCQGG